MSKVKERIQNMKKEHQVPKLTYAKYQKFPQSIKEKIEKSGRSLKRLIVMLALIGVHVAYAGYDKVQSNSIVVKVAQLGKTTQNIVCNNVDNIVEMKTQQLQQQILSNVDSLQRLIIHAKRTGSKNKNKVVKKILDDVFPRGGLPGTTHYCVAGAAKARMMCNDSTLNEIMPDPYKLPREYGFSSSPNVSCPFMRQYFKNTLGENYAQRGDANFNEVVNSLEAGDIITVRSSRNTSSGEHCVTVAGPIQEDGTIPVMSLNTEDNYNVSSKQIVGAAKVIAQYRECLTYTLTACYAEECAAFKSSIASNQQIDIAQDTISYLKQLTASRSI